MLQPLIAQFLEYCELANFSARSIQAIEIRLRELRFFALGHKLRAVADITYLHLVEFTAQYHQPSIHVRKSRVWALRQFFHFPALHGHVLSPGRVKRHVGAEKILTICLSHVQHIVQILYRRH